MEQICDYAMRLMSKKVMFRGQVDEELDQKVRAVVVLRRLSLSEITQQALEEWLRQPENQEIIEKHNLR